MIEGRIDDSAVVATLERMARAMRSMADPMREIGRVLKTSTQLRFRDEEDPSGVAWKPSVRVVDASFRFNFGGQTLSLTRRLRNSISYVSDASSVEVGTNVAYAAAHQFGRQGTEAVDAHVRQIRSVYGRQLKAPIAVQVGAFTRRVNLVARAFLGLSQADRQAVLRVAADHLARASGGAIQG